MPLDLHCIDCSCVPYTLQTLDAIPLRALDTPPRLHVILSFPQSPRRLLRRRPPQLLEALLKYFLNKVKEFKYAKSNITSMV